MLEDALWEELAENACMSSREMKMLLTTLGINVFGFMF